MNDNFSKACKEFWISLKFMNKEMYEAIPVQFLQVIIENVDSDYSFYYDEAKKFEKQNFLEETKNLIAYIYYNYWADEEEKKELKKRDCK